MSPHTLFATSTTLDGNMSFRFGNENEVLRNRKTFLEKHSIPWGDHVCMKCDHTEKIIFVDDTKFPLDIHRMVDAEVLVTQKKHTALMLLTADCLPTSFFDPVTQTIALAHFSRQTIADLLPQKTVQFLQQMLGVNPANLQVNVGPHIHKDSYSFPAPLPHVSEIIAPFIETSGGTAFIDLPSAHNHQLEEAGVLKSNIALCEIDTATSPNHFSYYIHKKKGDQDGRLASILMMR